MEQKNINIILIIIGLLLLIGIISALKSRPLYIPQSETYSVLTYEDIK